VGEDCNDIEVLYYRGNPAYTRENKKNKDNNGLNEPLDNISWYYDVGHKVFKDTTVPKTVFASGVKISGKQLNVKWLGEHVGEIIEIQGGGKLDDVYTAKTDESDLPAWFKKGATVYKNHPVDGSDPQMIQFGGSENTKSSKLGKLSCLKKNRKPADKWYLSGDKKYCIFFDKKQKKWHICDKDTLYYRGYNLGKCKKGIHTSSKQCDEAKCKWVNRKDPRLSECKNGIHHNKKWCNEAKCKWVNKGEKGPFDEINWYFDTGFSLKGQCDKCNQKVKPEDEDHKSSCNGTVSLGKKTVFASGMVDERRVKPTVC